MVVGGFFDREQTTDRVDKLSPDWLVEQGEADDGGCVGCRGRLGLRQELVHADVCTIA